jgi:hypothetical protein
MKLRMTVVVLAAVLPGCSFSDQVELFNNTTTGIEVRACGRTERVGGGLTIMFSAVCRPPFEVDSSLGHWVYRDAFDRDMVERVGVRTSVGYRLIKLQLQRDGTVVVVPPNATYPLDPVTTQPSGFPLQPT